jgi:N-acetylmuramic acid 6-phosphate etherase
MLSTMAMVRLGYVTGNRMTNLMTRNTKLRERALGIVMAECELDEATARFALESADWDLRVAMVMIKANATREMAEDALKKSNYTISRAVALLLV